MKKFIIAFAAGQALQLTLLWVGQTMTYSTNLLGFCAGVGIVVLVAIVIGTIGTLLDLAVQENAEPVTVETVKDEKLGKEFLGLFSRKNDIVDMDEVDELPDDITVTNTNIKRA